MGPRACALQREKPLQREACTPQLGSSPSSLQLETAVLSNEDPVQPKINKLKEILKKEKDELGKSLVLRAEDADETQNKVLGRKIEGIKVTSTSRTIHTFSS